MSYKEDHTINIDTVENVIKFSRKSERGTCEHKNIQISAEENEVLCTDCNVRLNPVWWIQKHLKHLNRATERNNSVLSEAREIYKKLEKKNLDMVAANNVKVEGAGFQGDTNVLTLITQDEEISLPLMSKEDAAFRILDKILSLMQDSVC